MALQQVKPGDRIVADQWNELIQKVLDLEGMVNQLMATGVGKAPVITQILPLSPPAIWRAGSPIEINGFNFGYSRGAQVVTFDGAPVTAYKVGTTDNRLLIDIPPIPGLPETGKDVVLTVANGYGSTNRLMKILPVEIPITGAVIDVFWRSVTPNPITAGTPVFVGYQIRSRAPRTALFTINPQLLSPGGVAGLQVYNSLTEENVSRQFQLATLEVRNFFIRIPALPSGITNFTLEVEGTAGSAIGSDTRLFPLNQIIVQPDNAIALTPLTFEALDPNTALPDPAGGSYSHADATIRVRQNRSGTMSLRAEFQNTGVYNVEVGAIGALQGWNVGLSDDTASSITIEPADFSGGATVAAETVKFFVEPPPAGTTASAVVEFRVFRQGSAQGQSRRFNLALLT